MTVRGSIAIAEGDHKSAGDLAGAVIWLEPSDAAVTAQPMRARMVQKNKTFTPHVLGITVGSSVDFPNFDPIFHNAFSNFDGQIFDIGLYPPGKSRSVVFRHAGIVRVFCNIHPAMSAVIVVVDTPYFATTGKDGRFEIPDVLPGSYVRHIFYERATPETLAHLQEVERVGAVDVTLPQVLISEAGYLPASHTNKYGKQYPHGAGESSYSIPND